VSLTENFYRTGITDDNFIRGAARLLWAGITIAFPTGIGDVINLSTFDSMTGWNDLGATKSGVQIRVNGSSESFDVDQILGDIKTLPTNWECSVSSQLAEMDLARLQIAWEGSGITTDATHGEKVMGFGTPLVFTQRRLAVLHLKVNEKIRGYFFRQVARADAESTVTHSKTGEQISVPIQFKAYPDTSVSDIYSRFFQIRDQI
jgi:hypothetical protein